MRAHITVASNNAVLYEDHIETWCGDEPLLLAYGVLDDHGRADVAEQFARILASTYAVDGVLNLRPGDVWEAEAGEHRLTLTAPATPRFGEPLTEPA